MQVCEGQTVLRDKVNATIIYYSPASSRSVRQELKILKTMVRPCGTPLWGLSERKTRLLPSRIRIWENLHITVQAFSAERGQLNFLWLNL